MPRAAGQEKGKGHYWTFAGGCESLLDLFENGNYRRRRRRRGPKREGARVARAIGAPPPTSLGPREAARCEAPATQSTPAAATVAGKDGPRDIKFSIDYILSAPGPFSRCRGPCGPQESGHPALEKQPVSLHVWTL